MPRDDALMLDIARAGRLVQEFTKGMDKEAFLTDVKTQSAPLHQFMVLGEVVKRLSPTFRSRYSQIPWSLIAGMRDRLIHKYDEVDLDLVWQTVERDVPEVLRFIEPLLPSELL